MSASVTCQPNLAICKATLVPPAITIIIVMTETQTPPWAGFLPLLYSCSSLLSTRLNFFPAESAPSHAREVLLF